MKKTNERFNYAYLRGFINDHPKLGSDKEFARFLGISSQELNKKYSGDHQFTVKQILHVKTTFNLSAELVDLYFFNLEFRKWNNKNTKIIERRWRTCNQKKILQSRLKRKSY